MINYSRKQMERELIADQALWRQVPAAASAVLWPLEIVLLGWTTGWWLGLLTTTFLGVASVALPTRLRVSIYLIDLLDRLVKLPLNLGWLLPVWHLWTREPVFPVLDQPAVGAVAVTALLWFLTRISSLVGRLAARRILL